MSNMIMTPKEIVDELDKHIIGQELAKKSVAVALRNRWRRMQLNDEIKEEITPKNLLMIGPTGIGKTEIARRLAKLTNAPFIKVDATKFTEVGYVGRDVESIIRDLIETAIKNAKLSAQTKMEKLALIFAEKRILKILLPKARNNDPNTNKNINDNSNHAYEMLKNKLQKGELDDKEIDIEISKSKIGMEIMGPPGMEDMTRQLQDMLQNINVGKTNKRRLSIKKARILLQEEESIKLINEDEIKCQAIENVEENGIVFIDEIDKVCRRSEHVNNGPDISREGVQRDLLPLIEGCTVSTKYGQVKTDYILFIVSGAFHLAKPSDLIPELQGRLPVRVELKALTSDDFFRILTETNFSLIEQYRALIKTENIDLCFTKDAIHEIANVAWDMNETIENIGARRLHTVLEKLLEDIFFNASEISKKKNTFTIDKEYVKTSLIELISDTDYSRYIL